MRQTINILWNGSGQVPKREAISIVEQKSTLILDLSDNEAKCLKQLGQDLRGTDLWWGQVREEAIGEEPNSSKASVIKVGREPEDLGWRIQVGNAVGVIGVGDLQINVLPKIGENHFNYIAGMAINPSRLRFGQDNWGVAQDSAFLPAVWNAFIESLTTTLRADLHHEYVETSDDPPYVRGRLDIRRVVINLARGQMNFPAKFDELSSDNSVNRVLRAAAEYVSRAASSFVSRNGELDRGVYEALSARAAESAYQLLEAGPLRTGDLDAELPRLAVHQLRAVNLARHVLSGIGRSLQVGDTKVTCFLQPTPDLIEDGVRALLDAKLGEGISVKKKRRAAARLDFNPDLVIEVDNEPSDEPNATGDVKYRIRKEDWPRDVLLQAMGFAQVFTSSKGFFIDFSDAGEVCETKSEKIRDVTYHHITWPTGFDVNPSESENHLITELRRVVFTK
jgi:hypothetical protein